MKAYYSGFDQVLDDIYAEVQAITEHPEATHKKVLRKIGTAVKSKVITEANKSRSDEDHVHIADDVTFSVGRTKDRQPYVSVKGGKLTGYKWVFVNDGHYAANGRFIPGNHFVDIAAQAAEADINEIIDEYAKEIVNAKGG